jgi:hypothetical protein
MNVGIVDCGRAVPFLGLFLSNFRYCVFAVYSTTVLLFVKLIHPIVRQRLLPHTGPVLLRGVHPQADVGRPGV